MRALFKEVRVGFINGVAVAVTTSLFVFLWTRSWPLVFVSLKQDPAQPSSIFLTTVTDVAGFLSFLGIATLLSSQL